MAASRPVVAIGAPRVRSATTARATRRAARSSPRSRSTRTISRSEALASHVAADIPASGIHAHVQGTVAQEAEAAFRPGELGRRDPEVHEHRVDTPGKPGGAHDLCDGTEAGVDDREPRVGTGEIAGGRDRLRIPIHRQHPALGADAVEHRPRVPATAERAVDVAPARTRRDGLDDLVEHDRNVLGHMTARGVPHRSVPATGARRRIPGARSRENASRASSGRHAPHGSRSHHEPLRAFTRTHRCAAAPQVYPMPLYPISESFPFRCGEDPISRSGNT